MNSRDEADGAEVMPTATSTVFCRVTKRRPCLICGKLDWCVYVRDESLSVCMRVADGARKINSHGGAIHLHIGERQSLFPIARSLNPRASEPQSPIATIEVRDHVYSSLILSFAKIPIFSKHWTSLFTPDTVGLMIHALLAFVSILASAFRHRQGLILENLALRQQLAVYHRRHPRPQLRQRDRIFWVWLSRVWSQWRSALLTVKPETVLRWHREGFKLFWTRLSRRKDSGRPPVNAPVKALIKQMAQANPLWGAPRIHGELLKLGINISERTVSRLMPKNRKPPSQTWRTFLDNHFRELVSIDFMTVPTATFRVLYVFIVLAHDRRRILHFNVTEHPTAAWTAQFFARQSPRSYAPVPRLRSQNDPGPRPNNHGCSGECKGMSTAADCLRCYEKK
jgi:hypothetical protein